MDRQNSSYNYVDLKYTHTGVSKVNEMCNYAEVGQIVSDQSGYFWFHTMKNFDGGD